MNDVRYAGTRRIVSARDVATPARRADDEPLHHAREILRLLLQEYRGPVAAAVADRRGDRHWLHRCDGARTVLVFRDVGVIRDLVLRRDMVRLAEYYLAGDVAVDGDAVALFDLVEFLQQHRPTMAVRSRIAWLALKLPAAPAPAEVVPLRHAGDRVVNSSGAIAHHYDVSNAFYRLWLDPEMVYSCAYFAASDQPLADAQRDKLDYICRKLRLQRDARLLDVGCGWGALACHAARRYQAIVHGITLSRRQYEYAVERVRRERLTDRVTIELRDYRDLDDRRAYDRVVSVGMFEHVGSRNFPTYFGTIRRLLRPDGLFLNHGITNDCGWQDTPVTRFVNRYVFPDGELTRISAVCAAMEDAGFEPLDVESLRRHYVLTLRHWIERLERHRRDAIALAGEPIYRLWRLYMAGAAYYFGAGSTNVYQVLAAPRGGQLRIPLRRDDIYAPSRGTCVTDACPPGAAVAAVR